MDDELEDIDTGIEGLTKRVVVEVSDEFSIQVPFDATNEQIENIVNNLVIKLIQEGRPIAEFYVD